MSASRAEDWRARGGYFSWRPDDPGADAVEIFHVEAGDPEAPVLLLVHGFPTAASTGTRSLTASPGDSGLRTGLPGYGFSDKPAGWGYSLMRDARLLGHYLSEVVGAETATVWPTTAATAWR